MPSPDRDNITGDTKKSSIRGDLVAPLAGIFLVLNLFLVCSYLLVAFPRFETAILIVQTGLFIVGGALFFVTHTRIKHNLIEPLDHLHKWINRIRAGDLSAQIPVPAHGEFASLAQDINKMGESLRSLTREMDDKVKQQTESLERQTHSLGLLYDVAASSNKARSLDELLKRYLNTLSGIFNARLATARIITSDDQLRIVGCVKYKEGFSEAERLVPIERCLCAQNFSEGVFFCTSKRHQCGNLLPDSIHDDSLQVISMPLQYQNRTLGIYNFFVEDYQENHETDELLDNIGQHLSLAIEKVRLDEESKRISIMQERYMLANELHDSLAQTLASMRIRVSMLLNALGYENHQQAIGEALQLKNGLDEANSELRELLSHFRVRMDERGLIPALEDLVERFQNECSISVFFQNECDDMKLSPQVEVQVLHIIQESLTNIRKHSDAQNVRVLIRCEAENGHYHVLIEDDGKGIETETVDGKPGEHVGLTIMKERTQRINGTLVIDSEPGEGTRIEMDFNYIDPETSDESTL